MKPETDLDRAKLVVQRLDSAFARHEGLLREVEDLVENQLPVGVKPLSLEHAAFLFYTIANDHGVKSSRLYAQAKRLFCERPEAFDSGSVVAMFRGSDDPKLMELIINPLGVRYPRQAAINWYVNSERLLHHYGGNPTRIFDGVTSAVELLQRIRSFRGYGAKTGAMFLRAAIGLGFARVTELEKVLLPVDIHDTRIAFLTCMIRDRTWNPADSNYYAYVSIVQELLLDACNLSGIKWLDVDRALWLIGSRGCVHRRCTLCPLQQLCSVGQKLMGREELLSGDLSVK